MLRFAPPPVDLVIPGEVQTRRNRDGIRVHRMKRLTAADHDLVDRIPILAPAPIVLSLGATHPHLVESALNEARALGLLTDAKLRAAIVRHPDTTGAARVAALLEAEADPGFSRSRGERILKGLLGRAGISGYVRNQKVHGAELDFFWPQQRLNVEIDGFGPHFRKRNFESDRDRDARLATLGIQVVRITWFQLTRQGPKVVARIAGALAARGAPLRAA